MIDGQERHVTLFSGVTKFSFCTNQDIIALLRKHFCSGTTGHLQNTSSKIKAGNRDYNKHFALFNILSFPEKCFFDADLRTLKYRIGAILFSTYAQKKNNPQAGSQIRNFPPSLNITDWVRKNLWIPYYNSRKMVFQKQKHAAGWVHVPRKTQNQSILSSYVSCAQKVV